MYKKLVDELGRETEAVQFIGDGFITIVPPDPSNAEHQAYLKWLSEGNEPLPPDEGEA